jgi:dCTP deaminase
VSILNDVQIRDLASNSKMISPFVYKQVGNGVISYGLSSFGYDMRLGRKFKLFHSSRGQFGVIDPKQAEAIVFDEIEATDYYDLPPFSYALGHSVEHFKLPRDVSALVIGKSTYARCGLMVNCTPMEAGWEGYLTIELFNTLDTPIRLYTFEGICQAVFFKGEPAAVTYADRKGKYQSQAYEPVTAKVRTFGE